jgi:hypothetical protein
LGIIGPVLGLESYTADVIGGQSWRSSPEEGGDLLKLACKYDVAWIADLVLHGELASGDDFLDDIVLAFTAEHSEKTFKTLINNWRPQDPKAIQGIVRSAARSWSGKGVMQLLLEQRGADVQITPEVVKAAAANYRSGEEVMQLLLEQRGADVQITPDFVDIISLSFDFYSMQLLLEQRGVGCPSQ